MIHAYREQYTGLVKRFTALDIIMIIYLDYKM